MRLRLIFLLPLLATGVFAEPVELRGRYPLDGIHYLGAAGSATACGTDWRDATWELSEDNGALTLLHTASGKALGFDDNGPVAVDPGNAATFRREDAGDGWFRLRSPEHGLVHYEHRSGTLEVGGDARDDWWSAQWQIIERSDVQTLSSPDGRNHVVFSLANGLPEYAVLRDDEAILSPSPLGFVFKDLPALAGPFRVLECQRRTLDDTWKPVWGQWAEIRDHGEELTVHLEETATPKRRLDLVFRAYDDGVAFRYVLPEQANLGAFQITDELTGFHFTADADAWWCEDLDDTYERDYNETRLSEAAPQGMQTAATFRTAKGTHVSLHEAALIDWAGMQLKSPDPVATLSLKAQLVPWFESDVKVKGRTPMPSPWRSIQLADDAGGLVESTLILNLNEPCKIADTSWIHPSKFMGIWWGMITGTWTWDHDQPGLHGATTERAKRYIDACAEMGANGLLVEGWCEGWSGGIPGWRNMEFTNPADDFDILEVVRYGKEHGVKLVGHHETGGDIDNYERQAEASFSYFQKLGMDTVKTGYVTGDIPVYTATGREHHHGQYMVRHYQANAELAAKYHIMIDAHEPIKPTGISRTWPNFMAREGARGGEFNHFVGNPPRHTTILPFTRLLGGPMDYTPGLFDTGYQPGNPFATRANQLGLYVVLWSPLQMAADHYQCYEGEAAAEFIRRVPVGKWDDTRVPLAAIGDYVVTARRHGTRWYLGAVNDENPRTLEVPTPFLDPGKDYQAVLYADAPEADYRTNPHAMRIEELAFKGGDPLPLDLRAGGGAALEIHEAGDPLELPTGDAGRPLAHTPYCLRAKHSDLALTADATLTQQPAGASGQDWTFEADGDRWVIRHGNGVLTADGEDNDAAVSLRPDRGDDAQRWQLQPIAGSYYRLANAASGRLLDVAERSYLAGGRVHLWEPAHAPNQVWWIERLEVSSASVQVE